MVMRQQEPLRKQKILFKVLYLFLLKANKMVNYVDLLYINWKDYTIKIRIGTGYDLISH